MAGAGVDGAASEPAATAPSTASARSAKDPAVAAAALATFCAAVAAVRAANNRGDDENTIEEVNAQLAAAMQKALRAGVPQAKLLEASKEHGSTEEGQQLQPGDTVEIFGLESESGRQLNGQVGLVSHYVEEKGRFQVQLQANNNLVSVRPANLRRQSTPQADTAGAAGQQANAAEAEQTHAREEEEEPRSPQAGDRVEVHGLESESGKKLNGRTGIVLELVASTGRFKVELSPDEVVSVKPDNLRRCPGPETTKDGRRPSSHSRSSSSSSSTQPRRKKHKRSSNFDPAPTEELAPEDKLEQLLDGLKGKKKKRRPKRPPTPPPRDPSPEIFFGAAAAEAAQAAAAAAGAAAASTLSAETAAKVAAAAAAAVAPPAELHVGDQVEIYGLQSEAGRKLNGKIGQITKFVEAKGRFEVELGLGSLQSLKPENLRRASSSIGGDYSGSTAGYTLL